jgi:hypothetical protein
LTASARSKSCRRRPSGRLISPSSVSVPTPAAFGVTRRLMTGYVASARRANHSVRRWRVCPAPFAKILPFPFDPNHPHISRHPGPHRGAFRDRHGRRARDAVDAACQKTNDVARGRRSRVVLTPRRWRQEASFLGATVANKPGHRGEREVTVKTIARGMPGDPA